MVKLWSAALGLSTCLGLYSVSGGLAASAPLSVHTLQGTEVPSRPGLPKEADYYQLVDLAAPEDIVLEVGGLLAVGDGVVYASTRRGDIWRIDDAYEETPTFTKWADGLQEPLGLLLHEGWIYAGTRGELMRLKDTSGDGRADLYQSVCDSWEISGNYHEYTFGPRIDRDGNFWITLNRPFGGEPFGKKSWRGWAMRISPDGVMEPVCSGLRSPCGLEVSPWGDVFYTDNQGEWCPTNKLSHLEVGEFHGHPWGAASAKLPNAQAPAPEELPSGLLIPEAAKKIPELKLPAIWFPYDKMGKSAAGMKWDTSEGGFGPFSGQCFVADQHDASVMRVFLEKVDGAWQGACFPFRDGFGCGIIRLCWGEDGSLIAGMTNRGWGGLGNRPYGIQRLVWTGKTPTEIKTMEAKTDGFRLTFTRPMDRQSLLDTSNYSLESYTYRLHEPYGSPEFDRESLEILEATVSEDGLSVYLRCDGLREGYVHELKLPGARSQDHLPLLHPVAYYTLNAIPDRLTQ